MIITGGTGMVGSAFKRVLPEAEYPNRLQLEDMTRNAYYKGGFTDKQVIHLAAKVGGVKANTEQVANFYMENANLNERILYSAHRSGANRLQPRGPLALSTSAPNCQSRCVGRCSREVGREQNQCSTESEV